MTDQIQRPGPQAAVDTGGTFTDIGIRDSDGVLRVWKVPSTPSAPDEAVLKGLTEGLDRQNSSPAELSRLIHGTTVATNTVLTRTGARVGLLTNTGFRDILAIAHQARPSIYDGRATRTAPLIPDELIVEVDERMGPDGEIITELTEDAVRTVASQIRELKLDALVVSFLNAYVDTQHEDLAVRVLRDLDATPLISAATDVTSEMREYDRTSTAAINSYVRPGVSAYMDRLVTGVKDLDVASPLWVMQSNGGLLDPDSASTHSARTVLSGLAGGVVGAANWAKSLNLKHVVSFDIGGTSTDIALIRDGQPDETMAGEIDSLPMRLPSVDVHTIGAGGGSIAWTDSGGSLRVGPHSAGADPGPISYGKGGVDLTVTDAHLVLGRLGSELLGGRFELDYAAAHKRMVEFGDKLGMSAEDCAEGIVKVITVTMARGIRAVSVERGVDVRACHLMAFGGAGPLHGADLSHELGMASAVIPPLPGIASAVGMLDAPVRRDYATPVRAEDADGLEGLKRDFEKMAEQARADAEVDGMEHHLFVDARYIGQSTELTIEWKKDWDEQRELFDSAHEERYGFRDPDAAMEIAVARLSAIAPQEDRPFASPGPASDHIEPDGHRDVYVDGEWVKTPIYDRSAFGAGTVIPGPAVINQFDTTTYVRPEQQCRCDDSGFLHLTEKEQK